MNENLLTIDELEGLKDILIKYCQTLHIISGKFPSQSLSEYFNHLNDKIEAQKEYLKKCDE